MMEFIARNGGLIGTTLLLVLITNSILSFFYVVLGKLKNMTETKIDNKFHKILGAFLSGLHKMTEILSANPEHK